MRRLRPLLALLLNLAFLQSLVLGGGSSCAMPSLHQSDAAGAATAAQHSAGAAHHATHEGRPGARAQVAAGPEPSPSPQAPVECPFMTTCTAHAVGVMAAVELPPSLSDGTSPARPGPWDEPHSATRTVEPPPPRA